MPGTLNFIEGLAAMPMRAGPRVGGMEHAVFAPGNEMLPRGEPSAIRLPWAIIQ